MACTTTRLHAYSSDSLCGLHHHQAPCQPQQASSHLTTGQSSESIEDAPTYTQTSPRSRLPTGRPHLPTDLTQTCSGLTPRSSALRSSYSATTRTADTTWTCRLQVLQLSQWFTQQAAALLQLGNHQICRPPSRFATCRPHSS